MKCIHDRPADDAKIRSPPVLWRLCFFLATPTTAAAAALTGAGLVAPFCFFFVPEGIGVIPSRKLSRMSWDLRGLGSRLRLRSAAGTALSSAACRYIEVQTAAAIWPWDGIQFQDEVKTVRCATGIYW